MPVTVDQYLKSLGDSGIMSPQEVAALQRRIPPDERGQDAQPLAAGLVRMGLLTKYQAACVYHGTGHALVMGNYLLLDKLGQGDHGVVYNAQHREKGFLVAVKVLLASRLNSPEAVEQLERQVNEAKQLEHPNLVTLFGFAQAQGHHFLVTEYVEGRDLASLVEEKGTLPLELAVDSIVQAGRALEYAHAKGVIHGDIKPSHLLLTADGGVKLVDLGLAHDTAAANERSDIDALGHTLFTLVTGKPARSADDGTPTASSLDRADVPEELEAVYEKMVGSGSEDAYESMSEVLADLQGVSDAIAPVECETTDLLATLMKDASVSAELLEQPIEPLRHQAKTPAVHPPRPRPGHGVITQQGVVFLSIGIIAAIMLLGAVFWAIFGDRDTQQVAQKQGEISPPAVEPKPELSPTVSPPPLTKKHPTPQPDAKIKKEPESEPAPKAELNQESPPPTGDGPDRRVAEWYRAESCGSIYAKRLDRNGSAPTARVSLRNNVPTYRFGITQLWFRRPPADRRKLLDLHHLQHLEYVTYQGLVFDDDFVRALQGVPNLGRLMINMTSITDRALAHLKDFRNLSDLRVSNNKKITSAGCEHLASLANLEKLWLSEYEAIDDAALVHVARLRKLKELRVGGRRLSNAGLKTVSSLRGLVKLGFEGGSNVTDDGLVVLAKLTSLRELTLGGRITGDGLVHAAKLDLTSLSLKGGLVTDSVAPHLIAMKNLESLRIEEARRVTNRTVQQLAQLSKLRDLYLIGCNGITDAGVRPLAKLRKLVNLVLVRTQVTARGIAELKKALPNCNISH